MSIRLISLQRWVIEFVDSSIGNWLKTSTKKLETLSPSPRVDAEFILTWVLNKDRAYLFAWPDVALSEAQLSLAERALARRVCGEPIAHILGEREFWSLRLCASAETLIPRPDTEILVETVLDLPLDTRSRLLDLGTGTGAIAIAIAFERPTYCIDAVDKFSSAVNLAIKNCQGHAIRNVDVYASDWFSQVKNKYHIIVSNPPYIDKKDVHLVEGDVAFEPRAALVAEENGLADIRHIIEKSTQFVLPGGYIVLEHGWQQKDEVQHLLQKNRYGNIQTRRDYGGNDRVTFGQYS